MFALKGLKKLPCQVEQSNLNIFESTKSFPPPQVPALSHLADALITYYWTGLLILDHSYLVGNLTNAKIAETKTLEPLKS